MRGRFVAALFAAISLTSFAAWATDGADGTAGTPGTDSFQMIFGQGGTGGTGGNGSVGTGNGAAGGKGGDGGQGGTGASTTTPGSGIGGNGGVGGNGAVGTQGDTATGSPYSNGVSVIGGAGGGGGQGGQGGTGSGSVTAKGGDGGRGGQGAAGGVGLDATGSAVTITNGSTGVIKGGNGGGGGDGGDAGSPAGGGFQAASGGNGGDGAAGGDGIDAASGSSITNSGAIQGGKGGAAGAGGAGNNGGTNGTAGTTGAGGVAIQGQNLTVTNSGTITGAVGGDSVTRANAITFTGGTNSLELQAGSAITGNVVVSAGTGTLILGGSTNASFDASSIGSTAQYRGFTSLQKTGTSTWTLTGNAATAAPWTISGGTINFAAANNFGTGQITLNGGGLQWATGTSTDISSRLAATGTGGATFDTNGNNVTFASALTGVTNDGGITKTGAGTLTLGAASSYTGGTTVNGGTLQLGVDNALASTGTLAVNTGGTFDLNSHGQTVSSLSGSGTVTDSGGTGTLTVNTGGSTTFGGTISGGTALAKQGSGTLTLNGANTYTGSTTIDAGTLAVGSNTALGLGSVTLAGNNTTLEGTASVTLSNTVVVNSGLTAGFAATAGNTLTLSGSVDLSGALGATIHFGSTTDTGTVALETGTVLVATGVAASIDGGTLKIASNGGAGVLTNMTGGFTVGSGATTATLDLNGIEVFVHNLTGSSAGIITTTGGASRLDIVNTADTTFAGSIQGNLELRMLSSAGHTLTLTGANTYTGGTTLNGGTLQLGAGGSLLSTGALTVTATGTFDLNGNNQTVGAFSGSGGSVTNSNSGTLSTFTAGGNSGTPATFAGTIDGNLAFIKQGSGTLILTGGNTYSGGTTVSAGTLQLGTGGSLASSGALAVTGGTFDLNGISQAVGNFSGTGGSVTNSNNGTAATFTAGDGNPTSFTGTLAGNLAFTKTGSGTLTLTGNNTYSGGTALHQGTLAVGSNTALGSGTLTTSSGTTLQAATSVSLANAMTLNAGLTVDTGSNAMTLSGAIGGGGALTKIGSGTLTLSGTNTYSGTTIVGFGTLAVNGSITSNTTVTDQSTLAGTGSITGALAVSAGGTIAPGNNSMGTLTVNGAYSQSGLYIVDVNNAGQSDRIVVNGTATLTGGTVSVQAQNGPYQRNTSYTILTATGGLGGTTYSGVTSNFAFLTPSLSYSSGAVTLTLLSSANSFRNGARTPNQGAVGTVLDLAGPGASGDFATVLSALFNLSTAQGPAVLDAIGGQNYSGFSSLAMQGSQLFMNSFQIQAGSGAGSGGSAGLPGGSTYMALKADDCETACDAEPLWGAWGGGMGAFGTVAGDSNSHGLTYNLGGFIAGLDRKFAPGVRAGVATGFNAATLYTQGMPGTGTSNTLQFAVYGEYAPSAFYLDALAGYGHSDNRMNRPIVIPGLPFRMAQGYTNANTFFGQLETGYKVMVAPSFGGFVTPFARLQASTSTQQGFSETGADSLDLTVAQQTTNSLRTILGAQLGAGIDAPWHEKLDLTFRLGWSHEFDDLTRPVTAAFAGAPALSFTTYGATAPRDGAVIGLGANTLIAERTSLYLRYDGDFAGTNTNHVLNAGVRMTW